MCGIWGIIPSVKTELLAIRKFLTGSLIAGTVRGDHGSGIMFVDAEGPPRVIKGMADGANMLYSQKGWDSMTTGSLAQSWAIIGHNRAATSGEISDETAHPFQHGAITLVHNGYISNADWLPGVSGGGYSKRVDSEMLCQSLSAAPMDEVLGKMYGAYALAWHDSRDNTVKFVRNSQRPLHFMRLGCGGLAFASEGDMLWWMAGRAGFARGDVRELLVDTLLTVGTDEEGNVTSTASRVVRHANPTRPVYKAPTSSTTGGTSAPAAVATRTSLKVKQELASLGIMEHTILDFEIASKEFHHGTQVQVFGVVSDPQATDDRIFNAVMFAHDSPLLVPGMNLRVRAAGFFRRDKKKGKGSPIVVVPAPTKTVIDLYPAAKGQLVNATEWHKQTMKGCCECAASLDLKDAENIKWVINDTQPMCADCASSWLQYGASTMRNLQ